MAGSIIEAVATIERRYVVQVLNLGPRGLDSFVVRGNRSRVEFGTVGPNESKTRFLEVTDGEQLVGSGSWNGQPVQITIDDYATGGGNRLQNVVIFDSGGTPRAVRIRANVDEQGLRRTGD
ncbi:MAG: hypothetical protein WD278_06210 [Pirellulales bacterium]